MNPSILENFLAASTPGGIERQEKQGQIQQSFAETLPIDLRRERHLWEKIGFVFGTDADDIFVNVKFPEGWRKKPTDHSMWTDIIDDKGRTRGAIFYKAAFYDRSAHAHLERRFRVDRTYGDPDYVFLHDGSGEVKWDNAPGTRDAANEMQKRLEKEYPQYEDPTAYWDEKPLASAPDK